MIAAEPNAATVDDAGFALNHDPPELVAVAMVNDNDPPPALLIVIGRVTAGEPCTKEKTIDAGFTARLGWPGAVTVSATETDCVDGFE